MMEMNLQLFGGRGGSSGGGGSGGGSRAAAAAPATDSNGIPLQMTPQNMLSFFDTATPAQADALITKLRNTPQGEGEQDTDVQRFMNAIGWTEREPVVLSEAQWMKEWYRAGQPERIYHSDKSAGGRTDKSFASQYMGAVTDFAGNKLKQYMSGGIHGDGTYFAKEDSSDSFGYGTNQFRGFLNQNARPVRKGRIMQEMDDYANNHPAFRRFLNRATAGYGKSGGYDHGLVSMFAAMRGYNVIEGGINYISVLDRSVTTVSTKQKSRPRNYDRAKNW